MARSKPQLSELPEAPAYQNFPELAGIEELVAVRADLAAQVKWAKGQDDERKTIDTMISELLDSVSQPYVKVNHLRVEKVSSNGASRVDVGDLQRILLEMGVGADIIATAVLASTKSTPYTYIKIVDTATVTYTEEG